MVKLEIDVPEDLLRDIRRAVDHDTYESAQKFVEAAIQNELDRTSVSRDLKTLEEALAAVGDDADDNESSTDGFSSEADGGVTTEQQSVPSKDDDLIDRPEAAKVSTVPRPDTVRLDDGPLWGQYNRIFPVKLVVRAIANGGTTQTALNGEGAWIELHPLADHIADAARALGSEIQRYDDQRGRGRGEKLSTGLPVGDDEERSKDRFETHFVGRAEGTGDLTGAPPHLLFVDIRNADGAQEIGLTEAGREFATLQSPLLDGSANADHALSASEREFYLDHVHEELPAEHQAMVTVAKAIRDGDDRPAELTNRVAFLNTEWSESQGQTIRSGLTSRMYELGLVDRTRVSQRGIAYELTDEGVRFLEAATADTAADQH